MEEAVREDKDAPATGGGGGAPATMVWTGRRPGGGVASRRRRGVEAASRRRRGGVEAAGQRRGGGALRNHDENAIHTKEYHIQELQKLNKVRPTLSILSSWQNIIYKHEFCSHLYSNKYLYTHIAALSILHLEEDLLLHPTQLNNLVEL